MKFDIHGSDLTAVELTFLSDVNEENVERFKNQVEDMMAALDDNMQTIIVNFSNVKKVDEYGINFLKSLQETAKEKGCKLELTKISIRIRRAFDSMARDAFLIRRDYDKALQKIAKINSPAYIFAKLTTLMKNPEVEINELVKLINIDAALTGDVIKMANSSYYSLSEPCKDLMSAIEQIGISELQKLVGSIVSKNMYTKPLRLYAKDGNYHLFESVSIALFMEAIADSFNIKKAEAYTIGLLSNIGKTLINQILESDKDPEPHNGVAIVEDWERKSVGFDHSYAGHVMLKRLEFPEDMQAAILYQFDPERNLLCESSFLYPLCVARAAVSNSGVGFGKTEVEWDESVQSILDENGINTADLDEALKLAQEKYEQIKSDFTG